MYLYLSLALTVCALIGFGYGLYRFFRDESALYVRMIVFAVGCAMLGSTLWSIGTNLLGCAGMYMLAEMVGYAALSYIAGALLCTMWALNILSMIVGFAMLIYSILQWTHALDVPKKIGFDDIPDIIFDARQNEDGTYNVRYDAVYSNADRQRLSAILRTALLKPSLFLS